MRQLFLSDDMATTSIPRYYFSHRSATWLGQIYREPPVYLETIQAKLPDLKREIKIHMGRPAGSKNKPHSDDINNAHPIDPIDQEDTIQAIADAENKLAALKKNIKYNFQKQAQKLHSLYKLHVAKFKRNVSFSTQPEWQDVEHVHFFHSINSSGEIQHECVPIAGHFHEMILTAPATESSPAQYRCSGPLKRVRQKNIDGQWEIVNVPAAPNDFHTHEVEYKHSEIWSPPNLNPEFLKYQAETAARIVKSDAFVEQ